MHQVLPVVDVMTQPMSAGRRLQLERTEQRLVGRYLYLGREVEAWSETSRDAADEEERQDAADVLADHEGRRLQLERTLALVRGHLARP